MAFFLGLCLIKGFLANMPFAQMCMAGQTGKNQIRMDVDFTVCLWCCHGETEAPARKQGNRNSISRKSFPTRQMNPRLTAAPEIPTPPKSESPAPPPTPEPPVAEMVTPAPQKTEAGTDRIRLRHGDRLRCHHCHSNESPRYQYVLHESDCPSAIRPLIFMVHGHSTKTMSSD